MVKNNLLLLLLTFVFSFFYLSACDSAGKDAGKIEKDVPEQNEELYDFEEREFIFNLTPSGVWSFQPNEGDTQWRDAILIQVKKAETNLNMKFIWDAVEGPDAVKTIIANASSGYVGADILYHYSKDIISLFKMDILADLNTFEALNINDAEKWGPLSLHKFSTYNGEIYATPGAGSLYWPGRVPSVYAGATFVNDELITYFNAIHPMELHEQKQWTFDKLTEMLPLYSDISAEKKIYAVSDYVYEPIIFAKSAIFANGGSAVNLVDGKYETGYHNPNSLKALDWAGSLYRSEYTAHEKIKNQYFSKSEATLYVCNVFRGININEEDEMQNVLKNISLVPFPYGPDIEYGSIATSYVDMLSAATSFPITGDEQDAAYVFNYLTEPTEQYGKTGYLDYIKRYYLYGKGSYDVFLYQALNANYDYTCQLFKINNRITNAFTSILKGTKTATEAISALTEVVNSEINETMN